MTILRIIFIFTGVTLFAAKSIACSCIENKPEDYLNNCEVLFTAILSESKLVSTDDFVIIEKGKFSRITHIIKGKPKKEYSILNTRDGTSCDSHLMVGEEYVVCAGQSDKLKLPACGYTHILYQGSSEAFLKDLPKNQ